MTTFARRIISTPVRSASETWAVITNILAPSDGEGRRELSHAAGVACTLISSETPAQDAIVVWGSGPRVRVYCLFGEDAITGEDKAETTLPTCPTRGEWFMSLPCLEEDLEWVKTELAMLSKRVSARKLGDPVPDDETKQEHSSSKEIDEEAFLRP